MDTKSLLQLHRARYPQMTEQDCMKLLFQRAFAGGHLIADPAATLARLEEEQARLAPGTRHRFEPLGNGLCRLWLGEEPFPTVATINRLFADTANRHRRDEMGFAQSLDELVSLCREGVLPYDPQGMAALLADYRVKGCPTLRHSQPFREAYRPAYRVLSQEAAQWWDVLAAVEEQLVGRTSQNPLVVAVDGNSGAGKSSLAQLLARVFPCNLVHMDDFFLQQHQRTPQRLEEPGGNLDRERFAEQVIAAIGRGVHYQRYDCRTGQLADWVDQPPQPLLLLEGVYSMHPQWQDRLDLRIFLYTDGETQRERILHRNGPWMLQRFETEWIPLENRYFAAFGIREGSQVVMNTALAQD